MNMTNQLIKILLPIFLIIAAPVSASDEKSGESDAIELQMHEWKLMLNKDKVKAGKVGFNVQNKGKEEHELVLIKLNDKKLGADQFPVNQHGSVDEKNMPFGEIIGEIEDVKAGEKARKTFSLQPGRYALICNIVEKEPDGSIEAHYKMGMRALLEVE